MSNTRTPFLLSIAALAAGLPVAAQTSSAGSPAQPRAYQSAFEGYRPFEAGEVQDWRKSNDTVREVGGWRAYAREIGGASQPLPPGSTTPQSGAPSAPQPPKADAHSGHRQ